MHGQLSKHSHFRQRCTNRKPKPHLHVYVYVPQNAHCHYESSPPYNSKHESRHTLHAPYTQSIFTASPSKLFSPPLCHWLSESGTVCYCSRPSITRSLIFKHAHPIQTECARQAQISNSWDILIIFATLRAQTYK